MGDRHRPSPLFCSGRQSSRPAGSGPSHRRLAWARATRTDRRFVCRYLEVQRETVARAGRDPAWAARGGPFREGCGSRVTPPVLPSAVGAAFVVGVSRQEAHTGGGPAGTGVGPGSWFGASHQRPRDPRVGLRDVGPVASVQADRAFR